MSKSPCIYHFHLSFLSIIIFIIIIFILTITWVVAYIDPVKTVLKTNPPMAMPLTMPMTMNDVWDLYREELKRVESQIHTDLKSDVQLIDIIRYDLNSTYIKKLWRPCAL